MVLFFFLFSTANADFYSWQDESGVTHVTDYPPPDASSKKNVQIHKKEPNNVSVTQDADASKNQKKPDVTLFTKNDCKDCDKAREFLKSQNISFTEYNMDINPDAVKRRKDIDDSEDVPFAIINRNQVYGFSESVYNKVLKLFP
jgi:glutaredoxin